MFSLTFNHPKHSYNLRITRSLMTDLNFDDQDFFQQGLNDSHFNLYEDKSENYLSPQFSYQEGLSQTKTDLQSLIYNNLYLEYDIFLLEEELKYYRVILKGKEDEIKRLKDVQEKKQIKLTSTADTIKKMNKKIKEVSEGLKLIAQKKDQHHSKQESHRVQRLACQEQKNQLYNRYCQMEGNYNHLMVQIQNYEEQELEYNDINKENKQLIEQIQNLESRKNSNEGKSSQQVKEELKKELKKLYQKIKAAEKEEERICKDYDSAKRKKKQLEQEQSRAAQKTIEVNSLYARIAELKEECKQRKWAKLELEKEYHQLLAEESNIKRQLSKQEPMYPVRKQEHLPNGSTGKQKYLHNFRIVDSQADQELGKSNAKLRSSSQKHKSSESQEQFDELVDRYRKINSKSKKLP